MAKGYTTGKQKKKKNNETSTETNVRRDLMNMNMYLCLKQALDKKKTFFRVFVIFFFFLIMSLRGNVIHKLRFE